MSQLKSTQVIRILLIDEHAIFREGLRAIINRENDMMVDAEASDGPSGINLVGRYQPDVVVTDLRLPSIYEQHICAQILFESSRTRVIILTDCCGDEEIYRALHAGAHSYLLKNSSPEELVSAIRTVRAGLHHLPAGVAARLAARINGCALSAREIQVLRLIVSGKSNKQIAATLSITEGTVKGHVNRILSKLCVSDRTQAVVTALRRGIVALD